MILGSILKEYGKLEDAESNIRKAIDLKPNEGNSYLTLGIVLREQGKIKEAEIYMRKSIEVDPAFSDAYFNLFRHYEEINKLEKLKEVLKEFSQIEIIKNELLLFRSRLCYRNKEYELAKHLIDNIDHEWLEITSSYHRILYCSYKAFIEDKLSNYDLAYSYFEKSNKDPEYKYHQKECYLDYIRSYRQSISNISLKRFNYVLEDPKVAFLIGFPRSGTTLLDTILRSHSAIQVIEEKPIISNIESVIKRDLNIKINDIFNIKEDDLTMLRRQYLESLGEYKNKEVKFIIDKLPLHTASLPLINLLFPRAKIIFTHRHPYDTVLSCFQQVFKPNIAMANLVSLESSSQAYNQIMEAWDLYEKKLQLNSITSKYEDLIMNFDNHTLKILSFLGLDWDDNVRNFCKTALDRGQINTPSSSQVVQPIYKSSIGKWKNYNLYFEKCHEYLNKWVSYFNYEIIT